MSAFGFFGSIVAIGSKSGQQVVTPLGPPGRKLSLRHPSEGNCHDYLPYRAPIMILSMERLMRILGFGTLVVLLLVTTVADRHALEISTAASTAAARSQSRIVSAQTDYLNRLARYDEQRLTALAALEQLIATLAELVTDQSILSTATANIVAGRSSVFRAELDRMSALQALRAGANFEGRGLSTQSATSGYKGVSPVSLRVQPASNQTFRTAGVTPASDPVAPITATRQSDALFGMLLLSSQLAADTAAVNAAVAQTQLRLAAEAAAARDAAAAAAMVAAAQSAAASRAKISSTPKAATLSATTPGAHNITVAVRVTVNTANGGNGQSEINAGGEVGVIWPGYGTIVSAHDTTDPRALSLRPGDVVTFTGAVQGRFRVTGLIDVPKGSAVSSVAQLGTAMMMQTCIFHTSLMRIVGMVPA